MPDDGSTNLDTLSAQSNPSSAPPDIRRSLAQIQEMEAKSEKEQGQINKDTDTAMDRDRAAQDKAASAETDIMKTVEPWKQKMPEPDPISQFGSLGSVFGLLASAFTHQPMVNGLNAAAAAINASRANDLAAYKDAYNTWKENTDLALKRQAMEHQEYQDAHQAMMDDFNIGQSKLRTAIAKYGSPFDQLKFQQGEYDAIFDRNLKQQDMSLKIKELMPKLELQGNLAQAGMELTDARKKYQAAVESGDAEGMKKYSREVSAAQQHIEDLQSTVPGAIKMPAGGVATLQQQRASLAADIERAAGMPDGPEKEALLSSIETQKKAIQDAASTGSMAGRSAATIAINTYREKHPDASAADLVAFGAETRRVLAAQQAFGTGRQGDSVRFLSTVVDHLSTLMDLAEQLNNGGIPAFNKLKNQIAQETGQAPPANFNAAKQIVGQEIVKAVVGSGAGGVTERQDAGERISRDLSNAQFQGARDTYYHLLGAQLNSLHRQYIQSTSMSPKFTDDSTAMHDQSEDYFDGLISDEAKKALNFSGGNAAGPTPAGLPEGWSVKVK